MVDKSIDLVIPAHDTEIGAMAVNPDGTHAVMLEHDAQERSWPVVVDLVSGKKFPVKVERGRWLLPAWR